MEEFLKKHAARLAAVLMTLISVLAVFAYELPIYPLTGSGVFHMLSDGFLIAAVLFIIVGGFLILHYLGIFDWVCYLFYKLLQRVDDFSVGKHKTREKLTYYQYISSLKHTKTGYQTSLLFALLSFVLSLLFLGICSLIS